MSLTMPVFFQAIGKGSSSIMRPLTRQIFCLIPIFWILSRISLTASWPAFPRSEVITGGTGLWLLLRQIRLWKIEEKNRSQKMKGRWLL